MEKLQLKVVGMSCEGCENRISNALKLIDGVANVFAYHKEEKVIVELEKDVDKKIIIQKIEDLGFEVK